MSASRTVFMFSGQGSNYFQMGRELFDRNQAFRDSMLQLDAVVRRAAGMSVIEILYGPGQKTEVFDRTVLTHPAIFMVEYALAQTLMRAGVVPDVVLGTSLGSFAAAALAGFADVEEMLEIVIRQAQALEAHCEPGGMLAVLADPALFAERFLSAQSELAGINFHAHFVISFRTAALGSIEAGLHQRTLTYQRLPVSVAFHSQWIDRAREPLAAATRPMRGARLQLPLACCEQAAVLSVLPDDYFWRVIRQPILFRETIAQLERAGSHRYIDVGPSGTLATFLKYGLPAGSASTAHAILTPYGRDQKNLDAVLTSSVH